MKQGLSSLPSLHLSQCFLGIWSLHFSGFCQGAGNPYEVAHDNPIFLKKIFCHQNCGNGPKIGFLILKKNLVVNFHCIFSIMNMFIICCVPSQSHISEKSCSWDVGQNTLSQSNCIISKWTISPEQMSKSGL